MAFFQLSSRENNNGDWFQYLYNHIQSLGKSLASAVSVVHPPSFQCLEEYGRGPRGMKQLGQSDGISRFTHEYIFKSQRCMHRTINIPNPSFLELLFTCYACVFPINTHAFLTWLVMLPSRSSCSNLIIILKKSIVITMMLMLIHYISIPSPFNDITFWSWKCISLSVSSNFARRYSFCSSKSSFNSETWISSLFKVVSFST